jgi:hypothetical protein
VSRCRDRQGERESEAKESERGFARNKGYQVPLIQVNKKKRLFGKISMERLPVLYTVHPVKPRTSL